VAGALCPLWLVGFRGLLRGVPVELCAEIPDPPGGQGILRTAKQIGDLSRPSSLVPAETARRPRAARRHATVLTPRATTVTGLRKHALSTRPAAFELPKKATTPYG
jgi:hypothetical protein